jgi:hypothetical protein
MKRRFAGLAVALVLALAGCGPDTKHEILEKAENVETKADLEAALGAPDDRDKVGPIETWTYEVSDGEVTFVITGETVRMQTTSEPGS